MKTENEAYLTLAALCAQAEHCQYEMTEKMRRWEYFSYFHNLEHL